MGFIKDYSRTLRGVRFFKIMNIKLNHILCIGGVIVAIIGFCMCNSTPGYVWIPTALAGIGSFMIGGFGNIK